MSLELLERLWKLAEYNGTGANSIIRDGLREAVREIESLRARLSQAGAGGGVVEPWAIARKVVAEALEQGGSTEAAALVLDGSCDGWADVILAHRAILAALAPSPSAGEPVGEIVMFEGVGKEVSWRNGKLPAAGTKLYATPPATPAQPAASVEAVDFLRWIVETAERGKLHPTHHLLDRANAYLASLTPAPTQGDGGLIATPALRTCGPLVPLGADFEAVYDAHVADLYDPSTPSPSPASAPSPGGGPAVTETPATSNPQSACAGEEAGQSAEEVQQQRTASSAFAKLLLTAKTLYANAEGCAVNHYGDDFATHGLPGWLSDCAADIQVAEQALANPSPAGGVREALTLTMKVNEGIDATLFTAGGVYVGAIRDIEIARQIVAALSSPATPEPVSAPAGEVVANIIKKHARISIDQDWEGMRYAILGIDEAAREIAALSKHEAKS